MEALRKEDLMESGQVRWKDHKGIEYFCISDVAEYLKEDFKMIRSVILDYDGTDLSCATIEQIEKSRYKEPLTDFNKMLLKARKFGTES